jgi:hypothetical protein
MILTAALAAAVGPIRRISQFSRSAPTPSFRSPNLSSPETPLLACISDTFVAAHRRQAIAEEHRDHLVQPEHRSKIARSSSSGGHPFQFQHLPGKRNCPLSTNCRN